jgi:hypothetical protein
LASVAVRGDQSAAHRLFSARAIGLAVSPDISLITARDGFVSYKICIEQLLNKIMEKKKIERKAELEFIRIAEEEEEGEGGEIKAERKRDFNGLILTGYSNPDVAVLITNITEMLITFSGKLPWIEVSVRVKVKVRVKG